MIILCVGGGARVRGRSEKHEKEERWLNILPLIQKLINL